MSSNGGISGSTSVSAIGCCSSISCVDGVEGVDDVVDGVEGVADVVDDVTFAASHATFFALVSFCPGSYCFPVSPSSFVSWGVKHNFENFKSTGLHRHGGSDICTKGCKECFMT